MVIFVRSKVNVNFIMFKGKVVRDGFSLCCIVMFFVGVMLLFLLIFEFVVVGIMFFKLEL